MRILIFISGLLLVVFLFLYGCKRLDPKFSISGLMDRILKAPAPPVPLYPVANLYDNYRADYEKFSVIVRDCLLAVGGKCGLSAPSNPFKIHCTNVNSRVSRSAGGVTFSYDVDRVTPPFQDIVNKVDRSVPADDIAQILRDNLRVYSRGGYVYRDILIWPLGPSVRVEVQGVDRICPPAEVPYD